MSFFKLLDEPKKPAPPVIYRLPAQAPLHDFVLLEIVGSSVWKVKMPDGTEKLLKPNMTLERKLMLWSLDKSDDWLPKDIRCVGERTDPRGFTYYWKFTQL